MHAPPPQLRCCSLHSSPTPRDGDDRQCMWRCPEASLATCRSVLQQSTQFFQAWSEIYTPLSESACWRCCVHHPEYCWALAGEKQGTPVPAHAKHSNDEMELSQQVLNAQATYMMMLLLRRPMCFVLVTICLNFP